MVIEDDDRIVEALAITLKMRWKDLNLCNANTGKQGLNVIENEQFDLILLDLGLPDIDGLQLLKQIRLSCNTFDNNNHKG
jgi:two-component system KDP operon response regulator KdpE